MASVEVRRWRELHSAFAEAEQDLCAAIGPAGLKRIGSTSAYLILHDLATYGPLTQGELREGLSVSKPTICEVVRRLVGKGYINNDRDPADGRVRIVTLTDAGAEALRLTNEETANA